MPKRRRSRKQIAAARRNIKKAHAGKRRKKICRRAAGKRGAAKRLRRRMPSMPRICRPKRRKARRTASHRVSHRKSPKRIAAGRKAARTRKRKGRKTRYPELHHSQMAWESPRRRKRRSSKRRRKNPIAANPLPNPRRRRRRSHHRRRHTHHRRHSSRMRNPLPNPLTGTGEFVSGLFGVGAGFALASMADRWAATHPLTTQAPGVFTDTPAAGQVYDSEATQLPIWKDPMRIGVALGAILFPGLLTRFVVKGSKAKAFAQLATFGAIGRTVGKAIDDGIASLAAGSGPLSTSEYAQRLYGAELAATSRLAQLKSGSAPLVAAAGGSSLQQPAGQFAGVPRGVGQIPGGHLESPSRMIGDCSPIDPMGNHDQGPLPPFSFDRATGNDDGQSEFSCYTAGQENCCPLPPQLPQTNPYARSPQPPPMVPQPQQPPVPPAILPPTPALPAAIGCPDGTTWDPVRQTCIPVGGPPPPAFQTPPAQPNAPSDLPHRPPTPAAPAPYFPR
jgi:hypothetical protein